MAGRYTPETAKKNEAYRNRYMKENYDRITILRTKGDKERLKALAESSGISVNELVNSVIDKYLLNQI